MLFLSVVLKRHNYTSYSERGTDLGERRLDTKASSFKTTNDDYSCNIYMGVSMCLCLCGCMRARCCVMGWRCERSQRARREHRRRRRETWTRVVSSRITEESETERCGKERKWSGNSERCVKVSRWFCVSWP